MASKKKSSKKKNTNSKSKIKKTTSTKKSAKNANTKKSADEIKKVAVEKPAMIYKLTPQGSRSIVGLEVYKTDEENYEPYVSPFNQADNSSEDDTSKSNGSDSDEEDEDTDDKNSDKDNSKKKNKKNKSTKKSKNKTSNVTIKNSEKSNDDDDDSSSSTATTSEPKNIIMSIDLNDTASDKKTLNKIESILEKAGHKVEQLGVGPGILQSAMQSSSNKGKTGVFIVNGADIGTYKDVAVGIKQGYYHAKYCYFGLQGWISPSTCSCKGAKSVKLGKAHDDNYSSAGFTSNVSGKTTAEVCQMYKKQIAYACGDSAEELGNNLVKVMGGDVSDGSDKKEDNGGTIKEALQKLLTHWDGEVECYIRGDTVHVNKVRNPEEYHSSVLQEGINVFREGINIQDINPNTVNTLIVDWTGGTITLTDDKLVDRFGEISKEITAVKKVIQEVTVSNDDSDSEDSEDTEDDTDEDTGDE